MIGRVVSVKSQKTVTVLVENIVTHPLYKKIYVQSKKYLVDDAIGVKVGDIVDFINCRPISKGKSWKITKIVGKDVVELAKEHMKEKAEQAIAEIMPEEKAEDSVVSEVVAEKKEEKIEKTEKPKEKAKKEEGSKKAKKEKK